MSTVGVTPSTVALQAAELRWAEALQGTGRVFRPASEEAFFGYFLCGEFISSFPLTRRKDGSVALHDGHKDQLGEDVLNNVDGVLSIYCGRFKPCTPILTFPLLGRGT